MRVKRGTPSSAWDKKAEQETYIACSDILNNYFFLEDVRKIFKNKEVNQGNSGYGIEKIKDY